MKKVIFVCLLSLSVCLSQAATPLEAAAQAPPLVPTQNVTATDTKANEAKPDPSTAAAGTTNKTTVIVAGPQNATAANATHVLNETSIKTNETKPAVNNNSTETKPSPDVPANHVDPLKEKNETKTVDPVPTNNATNADASKDGKKNDTTTPKGGNVSPIAAPVEAKSRAFDGPSFIGGIILTLGLLAIGFMGFKYYKNQTERNYHTL